MFLLSVQKLFDAVRAVLAGVSSVELIDVDDRACYLTNESREGEHTNLVLSYDQERFVLPDFSVFSEDPSARIRLLQESASDVNLPLSSQEEWQSECGHKK